MPRLGQTLTGTALEQARENGKLGGRPKGSKTRPKVRKARIRARLLADADMSADHVVEGIRRGAFYDPRMLFDSKGNLRPIHSLSAREAWCIAGYDVVTRNVTSGDNATETVIKVRLISREKYLEMAAKYHGLLIDRVEIDTTPLFALPAGTQVRLGPMVSHKVIDVAPDVQGQKDALMPAQGQDGEGVGAASAEGPGPLLDPVEAPVHPKNEH